MFHLDNNSGVSAMPPVGAVQSSAPRWFTEGGGGTPASYPGAAWYNIIQAELLSVLSAGGVAPDKASNEQLIEALRSMFMRRDQNGADIPDVSAFLKNLRLGAGAIPIGMPFFWPSAAMPNTVMEEWADHVFLKWNDATFSATQFPKLAKVIPSLRLNDARGDFPRICDDGRGVDSGRVLLSSQSATGIRTAAMDYFGYDETTSGGIVGTAYVSSDSIAYAQPPGAMSPNGLKTLIPIMTDNCITAQQIPAGLSNPYGAWITMRPRNIAFNFLVRAK